MRVARTLGHVIRADFLERVRRHGFLVALAATLWAAYVFLPPHGARYITLSIAQHRGVYGSAWIGAAVSLLASAFLSLIGFYLVKNTLERDRATGVGQILAATPLSKPLYTLGKTLSNFAVLATMTGLLALGALGMQWLRAEDTRIDLIALLMPFAVSTLPALLIVSAAAVLFESVRWLRGGLGNVVYFFVWALLILATQPHPLTQISGIGDFLGTSMVLPAIMKSAATAIPGLDPNSATMNIGFNFSAGVARQLQVFPYAGPHWAASALAIRCIWVVLGVLLALVASIPFDRFDTAVAGPRGRNPREAGTPDALPHRGTPASDAYSVSQLPVATRSNSLFPLLRGELVLMLGGNSKLWGIGALGLALACWLAPLHVTREILLPLAWIWPLLVWSSMGAREQLHHAQALVFSSPRPLARQLSACWGAGFLVAVALGLGAGGRLVASGDVAAAGAWFIGALFIPTLAMACGVWTGNGRLFEIGYLMVWTVGLMNHAPLFDFAATRPEALASGAPLRFVVAIAVLAVLAVFGRMRSLRM